MENFIYINHQKIPVIKLRDNTCIIKNQEVKINNLILIKFKKNIDISIYEKKFNLKLVKKIGEIYIFHTLTPIKTSNSLYNDKNVIFVSPDLSKKVQKR